MGSNNSKLSLAQRFGIHAVLIILCVPFILPLVWMISTSLKTE